MYRAERLESTIAGIFGIVIHLMVLVYACLRASTKFSWQIIQLKVAYLVIAASLADLAYYSYLVYDPQSFHRLAIGSNLVAWVIILFAMHTVDSYWRRILTISNAFSACLFSSYAINFCGYTAMVLNAFCLAVYLISGEFFGARVYIIYCSVQFLQNLYFGVCTFKLGSVMIDRYMKYLQNDVFIANFSASRMRDLRDIVANLMYPLIGILLCTVMRTIALILALFIWNSPHYYRDHITNKYFSWNGMLWNCIFDLIPSPIISICLIVIINPKRRKSTTDNMGIFDDVIHSDSISSIERSQLSHHPYDYLPVTTLDNDLTHEIIQ